MTIRERAQELESRTLSKYAAHSADSLGRVTGKGVKGRRPGNNNIRNPALRHGSDASSGSGYLETGTDLNLI